jgi:hypothetical protein
MVAIDDAMTIEEASEISGGEKLAPAVTPVVDVS